MASWPTEPEILAFIERSNGIAPDSLWEGPPADQREGYAKICAAFRRPRPAGLAVVDHRLDLPERSLALRLYRPERVGAPPLVLYLHGGGFTLGDLESHDDICAELAAETGTAVLAVDYRLAPEHRHPAALLDCLAALAWARSNAAALEIDPRRVVVAGDSAGAELAAAVTHRLKDGGGLQVQGQVLIYGAFGGDMSSGSYLEHAEAPMLTTASCKLYFDLYGGGGPAGHYLKPLLATDFGGLPPAYISAANFDPLRDDSLAYAERLRGAGVPVELSLEPQMVHSYLRARHDSPGAQAAFAGICEAVRRLATA